jgi:folate-binding protein YgfZ
MSTQHVEALAPGEARLNVLTNDKGRVVDVVHHVGLDDGALLIGQGSDPRAIAEWLDGFLFSEDAEAEPAPVEARWVAGADAPTAQPWAWVEGRGARSFDVVIGGERVPRWLWLGDAPEGELLDDEAWESARVAAGVPAWPAEVSDRFNPLELALHDALHWAKGCYIGQEVIARIDNYGKQARHLVGLRGRCAVGDAVILDDKKIGEVTSACPPRADELPNALAVVKLRGELDGRDVVVGGEKARTTLRLAAQEPHD